MSDNVYDSVEVRVLEMARWDGGDIGGSLLPSEEVMGDNSLTRTIRLKLNVVCQDLLDYIKIQTKESNEAIQKAMAIELLEKHWDKRFNAVESEDGLERLPPRYQLEAVMTYNKARRDIIKNQL